MDTQNVSNEPTLADRAKAGRRRSRVRSMKPELPGLMLAYVLLVIGVVLLLAALGPDRLLDQIFGPSSQVGTERTIPEVPQERRIVAAGDVAVPEEARSVVVTVWQDAETACISMPVWSTSLLPVAVTSEVVAEAAPVGAEVVGVTYVDAQGVTVAASCPGLPRPPVVTNTTR